MHQLSDEAIICCFLKHSSLIMTSQHPYTNLLWIREPELPAPHSTTTHAPAPIRAPQTLQNGVRLCKCRYQGRPKRLLSKQIHQYLIPSRALNHTAICGANSSVQRQRNFPSLARPILLHGHEAWKTVTAFVPAPHRCTDHPRGDQDDVVQGSDIEVLVKDFVATGNNYASCLFERGVRDSLKSLGWT